MKERFISGRGQAEMIARREILFLNLAETAKISV
jgi:hypothetical protein